MSHASLLALLLASAAAGQAPAQPAYDLVLRGGKIVDGAGNPWFRGDIAISKDKIALVGNVPAGAGKREIDASKYVVAPGFIDIHAHSEYLVLEDSRAESKIRQGVTTEVYGESSSPGPFAGKLIPERATIGKKADRWNTLGDYFDRVEKAGVSVNVASFVGLGNVWKSVMGNSFARPTRDQMEQMKKIVADAMEQGACGLSTSLMMPPDGLATTDDLVELCKVVAKYKGVFHVHMRNEGTGVFDAVKEVIEIARRAGVAVEILHIKIADQSCWGRMNEIVSLIDNARKEGLNIQANVYPYTRGNNSLGNILPPWAHEGGQAKMLERLKDPTARAKMKHDIKEGIPGWYNHYTAVGGDWSRMLISAKSSYSGLTMDRILAERIKGKTPPPDLLDAFFDLLLDVGGNLGTIYAHHTEKDMNLALQQPWCGIGSDGSALAIDGPTRRGNPHPRSFGTFPRILGVYVRERGLLKLEDAIRKMTSQNALVIGVYDRGLIRAGQYADVVLFDEAHVIDKATYEEPFQYSEGIVTVLVNGQIVMENGTRTEARPGKALRRNKIAAQDAIAPKDRPKTEESKPVSKAGADFSIVAQTVWTPQPRFQVGEYSKGPTVDIRLKITNRSDGDRIFQTYSTFVLLLADVDDKPVHRRGGGIKGVIGGATPLLLARGATGEIAAVDDETRRQWPRSHRRAELVWDPTKKSPELHFYDGTGRLFRYGPLAAGRYRVSMRYFFTPDSDLRQTDVGSWTGSVMTEQVEIELRDP